MNKIITKYDMNFVQKLYFINLLKESQNKLNINDKLFKNISFYLLPTTNTTTNPNGDKINCKDGIALQINTNKINIKNQIKINTNKKWA